MKLAGIVGGGSGRMGNAVFSNVHGQTIVRQYQPNVANPSTASQVNTRSRFKLMSQLASALSPAIAIKRQGLVSPRNLFVSRNFDNVVISGDAAVVIYENLQLTDSSVALPAILASRADAASPISLRLESAPASDIDSVAYFVFVKDGEGNLSYKESVLVNANPENPNYGATIPATTADLVVYAYGHRITSETARARYANYNVHTANDLATLYSKRNTDLNGTSLTITRGMTLTSGSTAASGAVVGDVFTIFASIPQTQGAISMQYTKADGTTTQIEQVSSARVDAKAGTLVSISAGRMKPGYEFYRFVLDGVYQPIRQSTLYINNIDAVHEVIAITRAIAVGTTTSIILQQNEAAGSLPEFFYVAPDAPDYDELNASVAGEEHEVALGGVIMVRKYGTIPEGKQIRLSYGDTAGKVTSQVVTATSNPLSTVTITSSLSYILFELIDAA